MTGKSDIGGMSDFPSHLSQPSRRKLSFLFGFWSEDIPRHFTPENCDFGAKQEEKKENSQPHRTSRPLPAVLPPVGRFVASQGGGRVRIPPGLFWSVSGSFSVRRKSSRRKGWRRARPTPATSAHSAGSCGIPPPALWSGVFGGQWGRKQKKSRSYGTTCGVTAKF